MTNKRTDIISGIMRSMTFSNGADVHSKASKLTFKDEKFGCLLDIAGIELTEAKQIQTELETKIKQHFPDLKISIVLTSNKANSQPEQKKIAIDGVKKVYLVASGKGGVGKSTVAALMAYKLKQKGLKVGVVDADIYGPSIPSLFAVNEKPEVEDDKMVPLIKHGIHINSIGFISAPGSAISWRGPMASKALYQLLSLTKWDDLDCLIVDSPPGTGDIHLSLLQNYQIDEVYMVTTPQMISKMDVQRAINLYKKFGVNIAGIIENMSYMQIPGTEEKIEVFPGNAGTEIAKELKLELLAQIPITPKLAKACDAGKSLDEYSDLLHMK